MKDYSYAEIGMLTGIAAGGALSIIGFSISNNPLFFIFTGIGLTVGLLLGRVMDAR
jgi:hypothetical protein